MGAAADGDTGPVYQALRGDTLRGLHQIPGRYGRPSDSMNDGQVWMIWLLLARIGAS
jgi:hypothetical protein